MKTSIIIPTNLYKYRYPAPLSMSDFPSGLAYVAGALKAAGHEVLGCNPNNDYSFPDAKTMAQTIILRHLKAHNPEAVFLGGICTDYAFLKDAMATVRGWNPFVPIVLGGGIVSYDALNVFKMLKPDFAVKGDAEHIVPRLLDGTKPKDIPNLLYWDGDKATQTPENFCYPPIESLPYPYFEPFGAESMVNDFSLASRNLYRFPHGEKARPWIVVAGRGCPFRCTFCVHDRPTPYHVRSPQDVMKELEFFYEKYRFNVLVILDELFAPKRERLVEFSQAIDKLRKRLKWDLRWTFQTHANVGLSLEDIKLARSAGCYMFSYGMESASETILTSMKKKSHPTQIAEVIPLCLKANVGFGGNFIFGDPAETEATMNETMSFFTQHCESLHMSLGSIQPYPGSALYVDCLKNGTIAEPRAFYESIDERRYLMTKAFPEKPWKVWCGVIGYLGGKGLWLRKAAARIIKAESSVSFNKLSLACHCPYCTGEFTYIHVSVPAPKKLATLVAPQNGAMTWLLKFKEKRLFLRALLLLCRALSLRYQWFKHLRRTVRPGASVSNSAVTGCPECNQCVRVEWSA